MPEISRFFGIVVTMHYNDHPPPHFHVRYGGQKAIMEIGTLDLRDGSVSRRVLALVKEWAALHQAELMDDWELARQEEPLNRIQPLE
jgi:hypothetical protein